MEAPWIDIDTGDSMLADDIETMATRWHARRCRSSCRVEFQFRVEARRRRSGSAITSPSPRACNASRTRSSLKKFDMWPPTSYMPSEHEWAPRRSLRLYGRFFPQHWTRLRSHHTSVSSIPSCKRTRPAICEEAIATRFSGPSDGGFSVQTQVFALLSRNPTASTLRRFLSVDRDRCHQCRSCDRDMSWGWRPEAGPL